MARVETLQLARISVRGIVQGVGFRPFIYRLATRHNLKGWVHNTSQGVQMEVEGEAAALEQFRLELEREAPPRAYIEDVTISYHPPSGYKTFEIQQSVVEEGKYQLVSPDIATCQPCLDELLSPPDRRYRYPFTNCTNCGPRFTIIEDMPYDRPKTTMRHFQMCPRCRAEYDDPLDRRFHAQPNACPECGPQVKLLDNKGELIASLDSIASASQLLKEGKIVAIKGLGGFLLACDATNDKAVKTLRERKKRLSKPFAIMVTNLDEVRKHCYVSPEEKELLTSPQSPIVLMKWKEDSCVSQEAAPNLKYLGVMLPYTPLHHLLLRDTRLPLVMTSGNLSEEPIVKDNDEALKRLSEIADYFLTHNRDIYSSYDDSVAIVERNTGQLIRRARSYAPYPIILPFEARQVLGCGAQEKNTFCLTRGNHGFLSQHIGDMENMETWEHFDATISLYKKLFRIEPEVIAHDLHPDYLATKYAQKLGESGLKLVPVQHHHAHIVSCMADNGLDSPVIGVAFDGTGMGADGHIWGGEFLVADYHSYKRVGHLEYLPLPGGDVAIKRPYRTAIGYILSLLGEKTLDALIASAAKQSHAPRQIRRGMDEGDLSFAPCQTKGGVGPVPISLGQVGEIEMGIIKHQVERKLNSPLTSSMGRLFDAISALLGIRTEIDYEGQAAVELEMAAYSCCRERDSSLALGTSSAISDNQESYPYHITDAQGMRIVQLGALLSAVIKDLRQGVSREQISLKFHNTVAQMIDGMCQLVAHETGIKRVVLSGGVFQNRLLLKKAVKLLENDGLQVFTHRQVPCNDGGISLGQAVIANFAS
jgi:hydrogenase maturation protein HypF